MGFGIEVIEIVARIPARIRPALGELLQAEDYAEETNSDSWEFSVEIDRLVSLGLHTNDFRWLVRHDLVVHRREITLETDNGRAFKHTGDLTFPARTCFVLTRRGTEVARWLAGQGVEGQRLVVRQRSERYDAAMPVTEGIAVAAFETATTRRSVIPNWDSDLRHLTFDDRLVKSFRWAAENQEAVITAFQEEGWPRRIDDPLIPLPVQDSKRRLSDTIKCLNRKHIHSLLHFRGDGTGEGVIWEVVSAEAIAHRTESKSSIG